MRWFSRKQEQPEQPKKVVERQAKKGARRNYAGAKSSEITFGWTTSEGNIDQILKANLPALRARSREQYRNNDYMHRYISLVKTNVIGPKGVVLQVHSKDNGGQLDELANTAIEQAWKRWQNKQFCDYQQRHRLVDMKNLLLSSVFMDGEMIAQLVSDPSAADFATSILMRQPESLDINLNVELKNGNRIRLGIEFDANGRAQYYYFKRANGKHDKVDSSRIIHLFIPEFIEQVRGVPQGSASLMRMNMLNGFEEAALVNARAGATKMGFIEEPEDGNTGMDDEVTDDGIQIDEASPGDWHTVPHGTTIHGYDPAYPSGEFGVFVKSQLKGMSAGLGVSHHTLANDLEGVNYSSGRLGELADREIWKGLQDWFVENFMQRVFEFWLRSELLAGNLKMPNGSALPLAKFDKFNAAVWQPRRWQWVDPKKEMDAHAKGIELGVKTRSEIIREMGRDPNDVWNELKRENDLLKELGIAANTAAFSSNGEGDESEEQD
ncbi:phage portal protein [Thiomicrorhabdus lithotrophica]|uniref:Phage portal protein n=1 Tax=Thiomicrorhabdus lithotrophica TaxID=2949997 RepID=A0ABY8CBW0_9GAMM|nr:phage portal protein [Thiomicrorhabdus lithotrophica]WEJ62160.1 phage portal protein [Thiomicrorhabdus lithotrophica]